MVPDELSNFETSVLVVLCKIFLVFNVICLIFYSILMMKTSTNRVRLYEFKPFKLKKHKPRTSSPIERSGHRIIANEANIFSFGGFNPITGNETISEEEEDIEPQAFGDQKLFKELWRYNLASESWELLSNLSKSMPRELASSHMVIDGNFGIVHGGTGVPFGFLRSNKTYIINLEEPSLMQLETTGEPPNKQYGHAMVLSDKELFVIGGTSGFLYSLDVHCLNLLSREWKLLCRTQEKGRYRHEVAMYKNMIIVFGGGTVDVGRGNQDRSYGFMKLDCFDLRSKTWQVITTYGDPRYRGKRGYPKPRRCHGGVQIPADGAKPEEFVICGGCKEVVFSDIWKINLDTFQWTKLDVTLETPLFFHSCCMSPIGKVIVFGGISQGDQHTQRRINDVYSFWVGVPRLAEMCWEAMLYYNPNLASKPKAVLLNSGVPSTFVNRITLPVT